MTRAQIEDFGILYNSWIKLDQSTFQILFSNDGSLYPKENAEYYFSSTGLLYVRYTFNGKLLYGGIYNKTIGKYHEVYDINEIVFIK